MDSNDGMPNRDENKDEADSPFLEEMDPDIEVSANETSTAPIQTVQDCCGTLKRLSSSDLQELLRWMRNSERNR